MMPDINKVWDDIQFIKKTLESLMEKQGIIKEGITPYEDKNKKEASLDKEGKEEKLEEHATKRLSDAVEKKFE